MDMVLNGKCKQQQQQQDYNTMVMKDYFHMFHGIYLYGTQRTTSNYHGKCPIKHGNTI